jgi:hypothetical protein
LTVELLDESLVGQEAVLEGRLSERNPLQFQSFIAYTRRKYGGEDCRTVFDDDDLDDDDYECRAIWVEDERVTPPLWLDVAGGRVRIANDDYDIQNSPVSWQSSDQLVENETKSYEGFKIGSPIFARGKVIRDSALSLDSALSKDGAGLALEAEFVYGGDRGSYLANQQGAAYVFYWLGLVFSLIGGLLVLSQVGWWVASLF